MKWSDDSTVAQNLNAKIKEPTSLGMRIVRAAFWTLAFIIVGTIVFQLVVELLKIPTFLKYDGAPRHKPHMRMDWRMAKVIASLAVFGLFVSALLIRQRKMQIIGVIIIVCWLVYDVSWPRF